MEMVNATNLSITNGIVSLVGIALFAFGVYLWRKFSVVSAWLTTDGKIIRSVLIPADPQSDAADEVDIEYEYTVQGTRHTSPEVFPTEVGFPEEMLKKYPVGARVTVYYNPKNPSDAVLERGTNFNAYFFMGFGILWTSLSVAYGFGFNPFRVFFQ
jgi:hypothetical protein